MAARRKHPSGSASSGAGPSGMIAAYYLAREGVKTVVFERGLRVGGGMPGGGMMFNTIVVQDEAKSILDEYGINTVCRSADCPNIFDCFSKKVATFLILGNNCTRTCGFCRIGKGRPQALDESEPDRIAEAAFLYCEACEVSIFYCPKCREAIPRDKQICPRCGANIREESAKGD